MITGQQRAKIVAGRVAGKTLKQLADEYGVSESRIHEICKQSAMTPGTLNNALDDPIPALPPRFVPPTETQDMPLVGFRAWHVDVAGKVPSLKSYNASYMTWPTDGGVDASCHNKVHSGNQVPSEATTTFTRYTRRVKTSSGQYKNEYRLEKSVEGDCCGIHAYKKKDAADALARQDDMVAGAVMMWGTVREHSDGYRAAHARPIALTVKPDASKAVEVLTREVAKAYNLPVIPWDSIEAVVSEFGRLLPVTKEKK